MTDLAARGAELRALHRPGDPLVLVNAWDVASARHVVAAGGRAVATSSVAVAEVLGVPDGPDSPLDDIFGAVARVAAAVDVPVTADVLDGYGLDPDALVERLLTAGAVGLNLEDSDHGRAGHLLDPAVAAGRLAGVRAAADRTGVALVVNARIDAYLHHGPDATAEVLARARHYLDAGADSVYPLGLTDPERARRLVDELGAPVNANLAPGGVVADLAAAGVARVSIGPRGLYAALAALDDLAATLLGPAAGERRT
jgi:2-methylisocitrate lyase-like PEP mutase family enzyme